MSRCPDGLYAGDPASAPALLPEPKRARPVPIALAGAPPYVYR